MRGLSRWSRLRPTVLMAAAILALLVGTLGAVWGCGRRAPAADAVPGAATPSASVPVAFTTGLPPSASSVSPSATPSPATSAGGSSPSGSSVSTPTPSTTKRSTPKPKPTPSPSTTGTSPYFTVSGKVAATTRFTVADLKKMSIVSDTYFSRGKDPKEATTAFVGVRLRDILDVAGLAAGAARVTVTAADGYSASFTLRQVNASYIDETRPGVSLPMIIAYSEDGVPYSGAHPFRLVMGQTVAGDYNRQYWVKIVVSISVL